MSGVTLSNHGAVRVISLDRPPLNAMTPEMVNALAAAFEAAANDDCKALVLTGANGHFSAGIDTQLVPRLAADERAELLHALNAMVYRLFAMPKPVVAAVPGHAIGAGLILPLACDIRLAARGDYKIGLTEAKAGLPFPAGPLAVIEATLSPEKRQYLALDSRGYAPDNPIFDDLFEARLDAGQLLDAAIEKARTLADYPAYAQIKRQLRQAACERLRRQVANREEPLLAQADGG